MLSAKVSIRPYWQVVPLHETTGRTLAPVPPVIRPCSPRKIHERFYVGYHDVILPHKFKIAVGGCPNNCVKPNLNDMGIIGQRIPKPDAEKCQGCKKCQIEKSCPVHVPKLVDGKLYIDPEECIHCGRCKGKCPFGAVPEYQNGYKIDIGGRWGKRISHGQALTRIFNHLSIVSQSISHSHTQIRGVSQYLQIVLLRFLHF